MNGPEGSFFKTGSSENIHQASILSKLLSSVQEVNYKKYINGN
jgi:hypothetical protein